LNGGVYVGSNFYTTFGAGSNVYSGIGASNPPLPAIHIGAADRSYKAVYAGAVSNCYRCAAPCCGCSPRHAGRLAVQCLPEPPTHMRGPCSCLTLLAAEGWSPAACRRRRVRVEGCVGYTACSTTNFGYELTFCPNNSMSLCVGAVSATNGTAGASSGAGWAKTFTLAANTRYTFAGFNTASTPAEGFYGARRRQQQQQAEGPPEAGGPS
jgi:hypothetical protein